MTANRLPDVYLSITDYGLGILPGGSAGIIAKVGVSSKGRKTLLPCCLILIRSFQILAAACWLILWQIPLPAAAKRFMP